MYNVFNVFNVFFDIKIFVYEDCLLYLGNREQNQILIIENRFIVFQNIPH